MDTNELAAVAKRTGVLANAAFMVSTFTAAMLAKNGLLDEREIRHLHKLLDETELRLENDANALQAVATARQMLATPP